MKHAFTATLLTIVLLTASLPPSAIANETYEGELDWETQASDNHASLAGHASKSVTSTPPGSESADPGATGSSVQTQYEDSSTWDEQGHKSCIPKNWFQTETLCVVATPPSQPQDDAPAAGGGGPRVVTITTREAATLIAQGSGITRQPPGPQVIISKAFIVYTDPTPRYQTTTILGTTIEVEFTPTSYTWNWGDGTTTTTTDPGHPYPHHTITHHYQHTATGVTTTLTTTWTTRYRPQGDTTWRTIEGTITTTETSTPYDLVRIITYLTDDAEEAQGH